MSQKFVSEIAVSTAASRIYESGVIEICHLGDELRATCKARLEFAFDDFDVEHARNGRRGAERVVNGFVNETRRN